LEVLVEGDVSFTEGLGAKSQAKSTATEPAT